MARESLKDKTYAFLGAGIIAGVFIERLLKAGIADPDSIIASDIRPDRLDELRRLFEIQTVSDNRKAVEFGDVVFLAVPPNAVGAVLAEVRPAIDAGKMVVSLAACIPTAYMENALGKPIGILRVIPNTPSQIGSGMNPYCLGRTCSDDQARLAAELLAVFGEAVMVPEELMDVATALTAVGPTYIFPVLQALQEVAQTHGLPAEIARKAAAQTVLGAAQLVLATGKNPDELKLMIGTRTLDEAAARTLFRAAWETAYGKISQSAQKLTGVAG